MFIVNTKPRPYISYLLRMWQVQEAGGLAWRAYLENPHTGERYFFSSLSRLYDFLCSGGAGSQAGQAAAGNSTDQTAEAK